MRRILIIEDDPTFMNFIAEILSPLFWLEKAKTIHEGKAISSSLPVDVVLLNLDFGQGLQRGMDLISEFSEHHPVVVLCGLSPSDLSDISDDILHRGAHACFSKDELTQDDFDLQVFAQTVESVYTLAEEVHSWKSEALG